MNKILSAITVATCLFSTPIQAQDRFDTNTALQATAQLAVYGMFCIRLGFPQPPQLLINVIDQKITEAGVNLADPKTKFIVSQLAQEIISKYGLGIACNSIRNELGL